MGNRGSRPRVSECQFFSTFLVLANATWRKGSFERSGSAWMFWAASMMGAQVTKAAVRNDNCQASYNPAS